MDKKNVPSFVLWSAIAVLCLASLLYAQSRHDGRRSPPVAVEPEPCADVVKKAVSYETKCPRTDHRMEVVPGTGGEFAIVCWCPGNGQPSAVAPDAAVDADDDTLF